MSFYRQLSPLEATYLATDTPDYTPFSNQFFLEGEGTLDLDAWIIASEKAALANPGVRLQLKGRWGWRYWDDEGPLPTVRKVKTDWDGTSSENTPDIFKPFDARNTSNAEIILIESSNACPRILFRTHHAITDGMGMLHWMDECFRALNNEPLVGSKGTNNEWDIIKHHEAPERTLFEGNCVSLSPISKNPELRHCRWHRCDWPTDGKKILPKLVLSATMVAKKHHNGGRTLFRIPSDLRWYQGKGAEFTLANASGAFDIETDKESTISSIQRAVREGMRSKADLSVFPSNLYLANWLPKAMMNPKSETLKNTHASGLYRMTGTVSYVGERDPGKLSDSNFTGKALYGIPIALENRGLFMAVTNTKETLSVTLGIPKALATHEELVALGEELHETFNSL